VVAAYDWLRENLQGPKPAKGAPQEVITNAWQRHVVRKCRSVDLHAYTFCVLDQLLTALHRRDVFATPSWRYADPRANFVRRIGMGSHAARRMPPPSGSHPSRSPCSMR
jgi:hypothetical protein